MPLTIVAESPLSDDGRALIAGSQTALEEAYPPEEIFSFDAAELARDGTTFLVARDEAGQAVGCVALIECGGYGEIKRLFVRAAGRGKGTARALMATVEHTAAEKGLNEILLETGDKLAPAVALYASLGYRVRGPFGDYPEHPASLFMGKPIA